MPTIARAEVSAGCRKAWSAIREANDRFEEKKDRKVGEQLFKLLPSKPDQYATDCSTYTETMSALDRDLKYREQLLARGDDLAFRITTRMIRISDGAFAEGLDIALGKTIEKYPQKFLKFLKAEQGESFCPSGLVGNTGEYDRDPKDEQAELKRRAAALDQVKDRSLAKIKATCLKTLKSLH
jgi:hypothetical protein